ncbi:MAG: T9SS type A sorting domain-containing protein, partial [Bacteroidota bacterium]
VFSQAQYSVINVIDATEGGCNGQIEIGVDTNNHPHTFIWSNGATSQDISGLCTGEYAVTITDANGCEWELSAIVGGSCNIELNLPEITITHYSASETQLGQIIIGGIPSDSDPEVIANNPYLQFNYEWENGSTNNYLLDLQPGTYCVTITDLRYENCTSVKCFSIEDNTSIDNGEITECSIDIQNFIATITHYCTENLGSIQINYEGSGNLSYQWNNGRTGNYIGNLYRGTYCVTISDQENAACFLTLCFEVLRRRNRCTQTVLSGSKLEPYVQDSSSPAEGRDNSNLPIIINEYSSGQEQNTEYVELLVLGNQQGCQTIDLRGFIVDDNNGNFSKETIGSGIAPGHLRFPNTKAWSSIPPGSLILIYNEKNKNNLIGEDDWNDGNEDGVYIIPASGLVGSATSPTFSNLDSYRLDTEQEKGKWSHCWMYKEADAIQVRYHNGDYCHGFAYGNPSKIHGGPDHLLLDDQSGTSKVYSFIDGDFKEKINYSIANISRVANQTPGEGNGPKNILFIQKQCIKSNTQDTTLTTAITAKVSPNPFSDHLLIETNLPRKQDIEFQLLDFLGREISLETKTLEKGTSVSRMDTSGSQFHQGIYYLVLYSGDQKVYQQKLISIK